MSMLAFRESRMNDEQRLPARAKEVERTPPMVVRETANGWERQIPGTSSEREKEGCPQGSNRAKLARRASGAGKCETRWDESYDGQSYTHIHVEFLWVDGDSQENPCCGKPDRSGRFLLRRIACKSYQRTSPTGKIHHHHRLAPAPQQPLLHHHGKYGDGCPPGDERRLPHRSAADHRRSDEGCLTTIADQTRRRMAIRRRLSGGTSEIIERSIGWLNNAGDGGRKSVRGFTSGWIRQS